MKSKSINQSEIIKDILDILNMVENTYLPESFFSTLEINVIASKIKEDYMSYVQKDPAARGSLYYAYYGCLSMLSVKSYRIAHAIYKKNKSDDIDLHIAARIISCTANSISGAEIQPEAIIGSRCVIDHPYGTVIGSTSVIGDDCYFLQNVTIGASGVINNPNIKRHPTLGNMVTVAGNSLILGNVTIGNNVSIGPYCVVRCNIPDNSNVYIKDGKPIVTNKFTKERIEDIQYRDITFNFFESQSVF